MPLSKLTLSLFLSLLVIAPSPAADKPSKKGKKSTAAPAAADTGTDNALSKLPLNIPNMGVKVPSFKDGRLASRLRAEVMTRVSDTKLEGKNVKIEVFDKNPQENMTVTMASCVYHVDTKIITSDERCFVRKPTITIEGDRMTFNTLTHTGSFDGNVKTVVIDIAASKPAEAPTAVTSSTK